MNGLLDVSTSALIANRIRFDAIAANLATADVGGDPNGRVKPAPIREAVFSVGDPATGSSEGVHVSEIREIRSFAPRHEPWSPVADKNGDVWYPDTNPVEQQANLMLAARSYEANIAAIEATKSMISAALEMLA